MLGLVTMRLTPSCLLGVLGRRLYPILSAVWVAVLGFRRLLKGLPVEALKLRRALNNCPIMECRSLTYTP